MGLGDTLTKPCYGCYACYVIIYVYDFKGFCGVTQPWLICRYACYMANRCYINERLGWSCL